MNRKRLSITLAAALVASVGIAGCKKNEEPVAPPPAADTTAAPASAPMPAPAPAAAPLAVQSIDVGNAVGADNRVTAPMSTLGTKDTLYVSVNTTGMSSNNKLGVRWAYVDGSADGKTIANDERMVNGENVVTEFHAANTNGWPVGKYKVEVMLDGAKVQTREFEIK